RKHPRSFRKTQFQSRHRRKVLFRSCLLRQLHRPGRRYAPDGQRLPPKSEEIPAREAGNLLTGDSSPYTIIPLSSRLSPPAFLADDEGSAFFLPSAPQIAGSGPQQVAKLPQPRPGCVVF